MDFKSVTDDMSGVMYKFPFKLPPYYALIIRSLLTLEGIALSVDPNFKILGPRLGKEITAVTEFLKNVNENLSDDIFSGKGIIVGGIKVSSNEIDVILNKKEDNENQDIVDDFSLYLDTVLDENLIMERFSRELVSSIQKLRKDSGLDVVDRIELVITSKDQFVKKTVENFIDYIKNETLAIQIQYVSGDGSSSILNKKLSLELSKLTT